MTLSLVMIVRDEARCLERCLLSARPFVDEIVVLDTGSTDTTVLIAQTFGARVGHFTWIGDFAAARNAALELADADWNLVLDADETVLAAPALINRRTNLSDRFIGQVRIESAIRVGEILTTTASQIPRLLPSGVRYGGRIHEQPLSALSARAVNITISHDGYLPAQREAKAGRNETLLLQAIEAEPQSGYLWHQLGREYDAAERYDAAKIAFVEALRLSDSAAPWRPSTAVRAVHVLTQTGALDEALTLAQAEDARWQASPDWHFALGALFLACAGADQANAIAQWLPSAETRWRRCLEIGETPSATGAVHGRGGHMAAHNLAALYASFGSAKDAAHYEALAAELRAAA